MSVDQAFFLAIALIGALFLLLSFLVGAVGEVFDDVGDFIGEQLPDIGDAEAGGEVSIGEHLAGSEPSPLSLRTFVAFMTAYGASGLITSSYGWSTLASAFFALIPGALMAFVAYQMMRLLYGQQASSVLQMSGLVGKTGVVDLTIPLAGTGKVTINTESGVVTLLARGESGASFASGDRIIVRESLGSEVVVSHPQEPASKE